MTYMHKLPAASVLAEGLKPVASATPDDPATNESQHHRQEECIGDNGDCRWEENGQPGWSMGKLPVGPVGEQDAECADCSSRGGKQTALPVVETYGQIRDWQKRDGR